MKKINEMEAFHKMCRTVQKKKIHTHNVNTNNNSNERSKIAQQMKHNEKAVSDV